MSFTPFPYIQTLALLPAPADAAGLPREASALRFPAPGAGFWEIEWEAIRIGGRLLLFGYGRAGAVLS